MSSKVKVTENVFRQCIFRRRHFDRRFSVEDRLVNLDSLGNCRLAFISHSVKDVCAIVVVLRQLLNLHRLHIAYSVVLIMHVNAGVVNRNSLCFN